MKLTAHLALLVAITITPLTGLALAGTHPCGFATDAFGVAPLVCPTSEQLRSTWAGLRVEFRNGRAPEAVFVSAQAPSQVLLLAGRKSLAPSANTWLGAAIPTDAYGNMAADGTLVRMDANEEFVVRATLNGIADYEATAPREAGPLLLSAWSGKARSRRETLDVSASTVSPSSLVPIFDNKTLADDRLESLSIDNLTDDFSNPLADGVATVFTGHDRAGAAALITATVSNGNATALVPVRAMQSQLTLTAHSGLVTGSIASAKIEELPLAETIVLTLYGLKRGGFVYETEALVAGGRHLITDGTSASLFVMTSDERLRDQTRSIGGVVSSAAAIVSEQDAALELTVAGSRWIGKSRLPRADEQLSVTLKAVP